MKHWPIKPLGELSETLMGQAPPGKDCNVEGNGTPFVKAGEFGDGYPIIREWTTKPLRIAKHTDVLVCVVGATCGKLNLGADCAIGRSVAAIRPNPTLLNQRFLYGFLQGCTTRLRSESQGSAQGVITREMLARILIPVPPLSEQERLVRLLDEADALRKLRTQADARAAELIPALFHEMFGDLGNSPKGWPIKLFSEVCESRLGKMVDAGKQTGKNNRPYLRNWNVQWGYLNMNSMVEMDFNEDERKEFKLEYGDVMICEGGAGVGQTAIWRNELPECYFQKSLHRVRPLNGQIEPEYIAQLIYVLIKTQSFFSAISSSTIPHLTGEKLKGIRIPVPPLALQNEFAARVTEIRAVQAEQAASRRRLDDLFQSMLHRTFNGEL